MWQLRGLGICRKSIKVGLKEVYFMKNLDIFVRSWVKKKAVIRVMGCRFMSAESGPQLFLATRTANSPTVVRYGELCMRCEIVGR